MKNRAVPVQNGVALACVFPAVNIKGDKPVRLTPRLVS